MLAQALRPTGNRFGILTGLVEGRLGLVIVVVMLIHVIKRLFGLVMIGTRLALQSLTWSMVLTAEVTVTL